MNSFEKHLFPISQETEDAEKEKSIEWLMFRSVGVIYIGQTKRTNERANEKERTREKEKRRWMFV